MNVVLNRHQRLLLDQLRSGYHIQREASDGKACLYDTAGNVVRQLHHRTIKHLQQGGVLTSSLRVAPMPARPKWPVKQEVYKPKPQRKAPPITDWESTLITKPPAGIQLAVRRWDGQTWHHGVSEWTGTAWNCGTKWNEWRRPGRVP